MRPPRADLSFLRPVGLLRRQGFGGSDRQRSQLEVSDLDVLLAVLLELPIEAQRFGRAVRDDDRPALGGAAADAERHVSSPVTTKRGRLDCSPNPTPPNAARQFT